jgi:hypothetical protein
VARSQASRAAGENIGLGTGAPGFRKPGLYPLQYYCDNCLHRMLAFLDSSVLALDDGEYAKIAMEEEEESYIH